MPLIRKAVWLEAESKAQNVPTVKPLSVYTSTGHVHSSIEIDLPGEYNFRNKDLGG